MLRRSAFPNGLLAGRCRPMQASDRRNAPPIPAAKAPGSTPSWTPCGGCGNPVLRPGQDAASVRVPQRPVSRPLQASDRHNAPPIPAAKAPGSTPSWTPCGGSGNPVRPLGRSAASVRVLQRSVSRPLQASGRRNAPPRSQDKAPSSPHGFTPCGSSGNAVRRSGQGAASARVLQRSVSRPLQASGRRNAPPRSQDKAPSSPHGFTPCGSSGNAVRRSGRSAASARVLQRSVSRPLQISGRRSAPPRSTDKAPGSPHGFTPCGGSGNAVRRSGRSAASARVLQRPAKGVAGPGSPTGARGPARFRRAAPPSRGTRP